MRKLTAAAAVFVLLYSICSANAVADPVAARLACNGTMQTYEPLQTFKIDGIFLEISSGYVKVLGSVSFDGTYRISRNNEGGVGFPGEDDLMWGYINRLSGKLSLVRFTSSKQEKASTLVEAFCKPAKPLF